MTLHWEEQVKERERKRVEPNTADQMIWHWWGWFNWECVWRRKEEKRERSKANRIEVNRVKVKDSQVSERWNRRGTIWLTHLGPVMEKSNYWSFHQRDFSLSLTLPLLFVTRMRCWRCNLHPTSCIRCWVREREKLHQQVPLALAWTVSSSLPKGAKEHRRNSISSILSASASLF